LRKVSGSNQDLFRKVRPVADLAPSIPGLPPARAPPLPGISSDPRGQQRCPPLQLPLERPRSLLAGLVEGSTCSKPSTSTSRSGARHAPLKQIRRSAGASAVRPCGHFCSEGKRIGTVSRMAVSRLPARSRRRTRPDRNARGLHRRDAPPGSPFPQRLPITSPRMRQNWFCGGRSTAARPASRGRKRAQISTRLAGR